MEENGRKWKEMGKSVVDVQIEGVFSIDHPKIEKHTKIEIHNTDTSENRSLQGYRYIIQIIQEYCYKYNI